MESLKEINGFYITNRINPKFKKNDIEIFLRDCLNFSRSSPSGLALRLWNLGLIILSTNMQKTRTAKYSIVV